MTLRVRLPATLQSVLGDDDEETDCGCEPTFEEETLTVDASDCAHDGRLENSPACRRTVISALTQRDADAVHTETAGLVRAYEDDAAALLVAAGRFVEEVRFRDERLAVPALLHGCLRHCAVRMNGGCRWHTMPLKGQPPRAVTAP